ncbi:MAG: hypothetical protein M3Z22_01810 [Verrucomicrobiota bacterium]|nr:hypothetical protein [Verrucomicrobiota bacterium]
MIETTASKSFSSDQGARARAAESRKVSPRAERANILQWLNLLCLDAPAVAVSWQFLFARSFRVAVPVRASAALFLTAWVIYLADRFGDSLSLRAGAATSLRQRFCLRYRRRWLTAIFIVALADLFAISGLVEERTLVLGVELGVIALLYLSLNQLLPSLWRFLPLKEISIGCIFAAGTMVPLASRLTSGMIAAWVEFAALCSVNCISIAVWERALDAAQQRVTIATVFPKAARLLPIALLLLALASFATALSERRLQPAICLSAALLLALHLRGDRLESDTRTALADLVLLSPLLLLALETLA